MRSTEEVFVTMGTGFTYTVYDLTKLTQAETYGKTLVELGKRNPNIVVLSADLGKSTKSAEFAEAFPDRFFNFGIAEQNMLGAAAGLALCGKIPFASTFGVFASMRAGEQMRTDIAYTNLNVRVVATHSGLSFGQAGTTHHCTEDIAIVRSMANMTVIVPADSIETSKVVEASSEHQGPIYIRIGRGFEPPAYLDENYEYKIGKAVTMKEGTDVTVIACGVAVQAACEAADEAGEEGISVRVINMHTIKPIDRDAIVSASGETKHIITAEEHNIIGGLGGAVAEVMAEIGAGIKLTRLGLPDCYSVIGYPEELYGRYRIDTDGILDTILQVKEQL
jgi:transketolase